MNEKENQRREADNRAKYVKRIVEAVRNMGCGYDHEDVWSILSEFQRENRDIIDRQKAEIERLTLEYEGFCAGVKRIVEDSKTIKSKAVKEFAEIVVADYPEMEYYLNDVMNDVIK